MKIIYNKVIPFPGFLAINLFGVCFVRDEYRGGVSLKVLNHESIHTAQMKELLYVGFYILYFFEWLYRLIFFPDSAYRGISFEREAYEHAEDMDYLKNRKHFAQWRKEYKSAGRR